jgi:hypothetical protein
VLQTHRFVNNMWPDSMRSLEEAAFCITAGFRRWQNAERGAWEERLYLTTGQKLQPAGALRVVAVPARNGLDAGPAVGACWAF